MNYFISWSWKQAFIKISSHLMSASAEDFPVVPCERKTALFKLHFCKYKGLGKEIKIILQLADWNDSPCKFAKACSDSIHNYRRGRNIEIMITELKFWNWITEFDMFSIIIFIHLILLHFPNIILTFVFFHNGIQKLSRLPNFLLSLWSQLKVRFQFQF